MALWLKALATLPVNPDSIPSTQVIIHIHPIPRDLAPSFGLHMQLQCVCVCVCLSHKIINNFFKLDKAIQIKSIPQALLRTLTASGRQDERCRPVHLLWKYFGQRTTSACKIEVKQREPTLLGAYCLRSTCRDSSNGSSHLKFTTVY